MAEIPRPCSIKYACGHWATNPPSAEADEEGGITELTEEELAAKAEHAKQDPESCVQLELPLGKCPDCQKRKSADRHWAHYFWDRSWW